MESRESCTDTEHCNTYSIYVTLPPTFVLSESSLSILFPLKTGPPVFLDMDCINFYQPRPNTSTLPAPRADKPGNATFLGLGDYEFVKSPDMGSQLVEESVFPFLESASELNANSGKFTFFVLGDFKLK